MPITNTAPTHHAATNVTEVQITDTITLFNPQRGHIMISYPNKTTLTVVGDPEVITQLVSRLDGIMVEYKDRG